MGPPASRSSGAGSHHLGFTETGTGPDDSAKNEEAKEISSAAVVPIPGDDGHVHGALAVLHETTPDAFDPAQVDALTTLGALLSVSLRNSDLRESSRSVTPSTR